jgi:hypothetical protein
VLSGGGQLKHLPNETSNNFLRQLLLLQELSLDKSQQEFLLNIVAECIAKLVRIPEHLVELRNSILVVNVERLSWPVDDLLQGRNCQQSMANHLIAVLRIRGFPDPLASFQQSCYKTPNQIDVD